MDLQNKYGTCLIPKGVVLFSAIIDSDRYDYIFFGLKYSIARAFKNTDRKVYAFKLNHDLEILFMLREMNYRAHYISSGDDIFNHFYPNYPTKIDDLIIKQNKELLHKMIGLLFSQKKYGWLNSLENKSELEICIFGEQINNGLFTIIDDEDLEKKYEYYDALKYVQLYPSMDFITKSKNNFTDDYKTYSLKNIDSAKYLIIDEGYSKERADFELYTMRYKLNI